jgi:hypothetical protein
MPTNFRDHARHGSRPNPLERAVACIVATTLALPLGSSAAPAALPDWARLRADVASRVFPELPATRLRPRSAAPAQTLRVENCDDDGNGSLRATVTAAASGDTIDLTALACSSITLTTGAIKVDVDDLDLVGPHPDVLAIDGGGLDRILLHPHGGTLQLRGLTLRNGYNHATDFHVAGGGCVASAGYVVVDHASLRGCRATGIGAYGGAVYAYSLRMIDATISGSTADGTHLDATTAAFGGAAFVYQMDLGTSTLSGNIAEHHTHVGRDHYVVGGAIVAVVGGLISHSTVDGNWSAGRAGGVAVFNPLTLSNSTVSGNTAFGDIAGGLFVRWPATIELNNSTVTQNRSLRDGGGIWLNAAGSSFSSSIVAGNSSNVGNRDNVLGLPPQVFSISGGNNLIVGNNANITVPVDTLSVDPVLNPLAANGGPTRTHALSAASPAIDAGANIQDFAYDQRGPAYVRVYAGAPDIGAFEAQPVASAAAAPVPALSQWGLAVLASLLAALAWLLGYTSKRRRGTR